MSYTLASSRTPMATRESVLPIQAEWNTAPVPSSSSGFLVPPSQQALQRSKTARKPLRSSPLAGPAVASLDEEADDDVRVPRVSSTPSLTRPLSVQLRSKSSNNISRPTSMISYSRSPSPVPPLPEDAVHLHRPTSAGSGKSEGRMSRPQSAVFFPSTSGNADRTTQGSSGVGESSGQSRDPRVRYSTLGASSSAGRPVSVIFESKTDEGEAHSGSPVDNSWYTSNTYAVTPKFTRLGLSGSSVIMPVSAKDHKKHQHFRFSTDTPTKAMSKRPSILKRNNTSSDDARQASDALTAPEIPPPQSHSAAQIHDFLQIPRPTSVNSTSTMSAIPSLTRSSSATSSTTSLPLTSPPTSATYSHSPPSIVSSSRTSVNESEETATHHHHHGSIHKFSITGKGLNKRKSVIARMKSWRGRLPGNERALADDLEKPPLPRASDGSVPFPSSVHDLRESLPSVHVTPDQKSDNAKFGGKERRVDVLLEPVLLVAPSDAVRAEPQASRQKVRRGDTIRRIWSALIGSTGAATNTGEQALKVQAPELPVLNFN